MTPGPWPPSDLGELVPRVVNLVAGQTLFRVHSVGYDADAFNPGYGAGGRFHFIEDGDEQRVPALYAAETVAAAVAETIFHEVPTRPPEGRVPAVASRKLAGRALSTIRTRRELELVELHHPGLARLRLEPGQISDTPPSEYPRTRTWAQALHDATECAGLVWMSRLHNAARAYVLFGDRLDPSHLGPVEGPMPLWYGPGRRLMDRLAEERAITLLEP